MQITINLNRVELLRQKFLRNFNLFLNCKNASCPALSISGNYEKLQTINLQSTKKPKNNYKNMMLDLMKPLPKEDKPTIHLGGGIFPKMEKI